MGTHRRIAALGLALGAMACGTKKEQLATLDAGLQKDLAAVKAQDSGLALAGQGGSRMQFVSAVEQVNPGVAGKQPSTTSTPARAPKHTPKAPKAKAPARTPEPEVLAEADAAEPAPSIQQTPAPAPAPEPIVVAQSPSPEPAPVPVGTPGDGNMGRGNRGGGGWGSVLGGIIGSVVIRGGMGGEDHCDPRHDGRARPTYPSNIPISRMPVNAGGVFGGHGRH